MGRLLSVNDLRPSPAWYLSRSYFSSESRNYVFDLYTDPAIAERLYFHSSHFNKKPQLYVDVRRWIERNIPDTVLLDVLDKSYRYYYGDFKSWDRTYEKHHSYMVLCFEEHESALMFKLAFPQVSVEPSDLHPDSSPDEKVYDRFRGF